MEGRVTDIVPNERVSPFFKEFRKQVLQEVITIKMSGQKMKYNTIIGGHNVKSIMLVS